MFPKISSTKPREKPVVNVTVYYETLLYQSWLGHKTSNAPFWFCGISQFKQSALRFSTCTFDIHTGNVTRSICCITVYIRTMKAYHSISNNGDRINVITLVFDERELSGTPTSGSAMVEWHFLYAANSTTDLNIPEGLTNDSSWTLIHNYLLFSSWMCSCLVLYVYWVVIYFAT